MESQKAMNSKTLIGAGLMIAGLYLFSSGVAHKITQRDNIKNAEDFSRMIKNASKTCQLNQTAISE